VNYGVSQPMISRAMPTMTRCWCGPCLTTAPRPINSLPDLVDRRRRVASVLVMGLHQGGYSRKHKATRINSQVARTITGCLAEISGPISGSHYDAHLIGDSEIHFSVDLRNWPRYEGTSEIT
jgi:hypothetical protein